MRRSIIATTLSAALSLTALSTASAADVKAAASPKSSWSCGVWQRFSQGLLYDTPGFFGTKAFSSATFVGCSQPDGGFDFNAIAFVPFADSVANEVDLEGGYTFVRGPWSLRIGGGYWNVEAIPGSRFHIYDASARLNYKFSFVSGITVTPWLRLDNQELVAPTFRDRDFNVGIGADAMVPIGSVAKLLLQPAYYRHVKSFGPAQDVIAVTAELPFDLGTHAGFAVTAGPWWRGTWGNITGAPGNMEFNNSIGLKLSAFN